MLRAIWSGSISFGLVGIPVKAVPAQSPKDIRFELLHGPCHSKMSTKRYCPKCERDVAEDEVVRGFQHTKGQYVIIEPAELEGIASPAKRTLRILDFVSMEDVDPVFYEKPYYLQPSEGGERTYALLHKAMSESGRVGIGKVALREREHLALIRPMEHALVMEILAFPDEVRSVHDAVVPVDAQIDERELQMAHMLINSMAGTFEPEKYHDDYREAVTHLIEEKVEGGVVTTKAAPAPTTGAVSDLMEMLRRSVEAMGGEAPAPAATNGHGKAKGKKEEPEPVAAGAERGDPFAEPKTNGRKNGKKAEELVEA
jgi:DNA end-binding protein Ku